MREITVSQGGDVTWERRMKELEKQEEQAKAEFQKMKRSSYDDWGQFNFEWTEELLELGRVSPVGLRVLLFFFKHMDNSNALVCSSKVLEEALSCSPASIVRALRVLKDSAFIKIAKSGNTNVFYINSELMWKAWGNSRRYAEFTANVVISKSEQEEHGDVKSKKTPIVQVRSKRGK
jgi:Fe2+ or Zn2+ uptake regulation protein